MTENDFPTNDNEWTSDSDCTSLTHKAFYPIQFQYKCFEIVSMYVFVYYFYIHLYISNCIMSIHYIPSTLYVLYMQLNNKLRQPLCCDCF